MIPAAILTAGIVVLIRFATRVLAFVERCHDADLRDHRSQDRADWRGVTVSHGPTSNSFEVRNNG